MVTAKKAISTVRVSAGSAMLLELLNGKLDAEPTTIYLMTYTRGRCTANCGFCPQARESRGRTDMLSRVSWPPFPLEEVLNRIVGAAARGTIKRVCIQALNYSEVFTHLLALVERISQRVKVPISISCQPLSRQNIQQLAEAGLERIGIALDAATEKLFEKVKGRLAGGPYTWRKQFKLLSEAVEIFGRGRVSTHLIVGLGETEREIVETIQKCIDLGVLPALFAFTPIHGTALEDHPQPKIEKYRRIQLARYLIVNRTSRYECMSFDANGCIRDFGVEDEKLMEAVKTGKPFLTSGCPGCNRPYYNEKPGGPIYNYPRTVRQEELVEIEKELGLFKA